MTTGCFELKCF